jgi:hypothetical protein
MTIKYREKVPEADLHEAAGLVTTLIHVVQKISAERAEIVWTAPAMVIKPARSRCMAS